MKARSWMIFRVLMNRFNPKTGNALHNFIPSEDMKTVMKQDITATDFTPLLYEPQRVMENMHYSWVKPLIEMLPSHLQPIALGSLAPFQIASLQKITSMEMLEPTPPAKTFFINKLYSSLETDHHLPLDYLPQTELSPLAKWRKKELVPLIDFLGLHDLATEIKHIVNKKYLENIYSCLSPKQLYFLKMCLYNKEKLASPKLGINFAEKNCERLKTLIHQRGLIRFSKALSGQHPDLVWYIAHTLDIGRGKIILKYYTPQAIPSITPILKLQVTNVMNFLKKSKP